MASHLPLTAAPPFRFLSLPRELRNNIYALLFDSGPAKLASPKRHSCAYLHDIGAPALRYVNKQVKAEFDEQQQMQGLTLHIPSSLPGVKQLWLLCCAARSASACATQPPVRRLRVDAMLEWLEDWDDLREALTGGLDAIYKALPHISSVELVLTVDMADSASFEGLSEAGPSLTSLATCGASLLDTVSFTSTQLLEYQLYSLPKDVDIGLAEYADSHFTNHVKYKVLAPADETGGLELETRKAGFCDISRLTADYEDHFRYVEFFEKSGKECGSMLCPGH